jgi:hypothetical protein
MAVEKGNPKLLMEYQVNMLRQELSALEDRHLAMKSEQDLLKAEQVRHKDLLETYSSFLVVCRAAREFFKWVVVAAAAFAAIAGGTSGFIVRWMSGGPG